MKKEEIAKSINPLYPSVYSITTEATKLIFKDGSIKVGYFERTKDSQKNEADNKYTFIEFNNAQLYRATQDEKYITTVYGDDIQTVEYPSYTAVLTKKLEGLKDFSLKKDEWEEYKTNWVKSITDLQATIMYKWLATYEEAGLMSISTLPISRIDPYIGEYITMLLELSFPNQRSMVLEPISAVTSEYNGRLDFYLRGNINKKVGILRILLEGSKISWLIARSNNPKDHFPLTQVSLESIINEWLQ